jgi:hypothetical protein
MGPDTTQSGLHGITSQKIVLPLCLVFLIKQEQCKINKFFFSFVFIAINFAISNFMKIQPVVLELFHGYRLREQALCRIKNMSRKA